VINLKSCKVDHWFRIDGQVTELYDTAIVEGPSCSMALGFASSEVLNLITHSGEMPA
jgi:hypothetical protein